jgi:hypothetical protein
MIFTYLIAAGACLDLLFLTLGLLEREVDNVNFFAAVWLPFILFAASVAAGWSEAIANAIDAFILGTARYAAPPLSPAGETIFFAAFMVMIACAPLFYTAGVRLAELPQLRAEERERRRAERERRLKWIKHRVQVLKELKPILEKMRGKTDTEILLEEILERLERIEEKLEAGVQPRAAEMQPVSLFKIKIEAEAADGRRESKSLLDILGLGVR